MSDTSNDLIYIAGDSDDNFAIWGALDAGPDSAFKLSNYLITCADGTRLLVKSVWEIEVLAKGPCFVSHSKGPIAGAEDIDGDHDVVVLRKPEWLETRVIDCRRYTGKGDWWDIKISHPPLPTSV